MIDEFYKDIMPTGNVLVATLRGKSFKISAVRDYTKVVPFLDKYQKRSSYHALGGYDNIPLGEYVNEYDEEGKKIAGALDDLPQASRVKCWGFDLDVGDKSTQYKNLKEATDALGSLIASGAMPEPSWVVRTGGGLQFYLVSGGPGLPEEKWAAIFYRLKWKFHELFQGRIDSNVASTAHSWLRSPCTPNVKYSPARMPKVVHKGPRISKETLRTFIKGVKAPKKTKKHESSTVKVSDRISSPVLYQACAAMREQRDTHGAFTAEPQWVAVANIAAHTLNPYGVFHECSSGHHDYDEQAAQDKYDHIAGAASAGPWGCVNFGRANDPESACHGCWAAQEGLRNPVSAARYWERNGGPPDEEEEEELSAEGEEDQDYDALADRFPELEEEEDEEPSNSHSLLAEKLSSLEDYDWTPAQITTGMPNYWTSEGELWYGDPDKLGDGKHVGTFLVVKPAQFNTEEKRGSCFVGRPGQQMYPVETAKLGTAQGCSAALTQLTFRVKDSNLMQHYLQGMALDGNPVQECISYGWKNDYSQFFGINGTILGDRMHPSEEVQQVGKKWVGQSGTIEGWLEAVQPYSLSSQRPYLMSLLASLAAPLLSYYNMQRGMILTITGDPGTGKSSSTRVANSVWGRPLEQVVSFQSTYVSLRKAIGVCNHLPISVDEHTSVDSDILKALALEISQGEGRTTLTQARKLRQAESWQTILITTGNNSYHEKLAETPNTSGADLTRVMEIMVRASPDVSMTEGNKMVKALDENHGVFGPAFIETLHLRDRARDKVWLDKLSDSLTKIDKLQGQDRFLRDLVCVCFMAHRVAKKADARFPGDPEEMFNWMREQLNSNRERIVEALISRIPTPEDFLIEFESEGNILIDKGDGFRNAIGSVKGYCFQKGEIVYAPKTLLSFWTERKGVPYRTLIEMWRKADRLLNLGTASSPRFTGTCPESLSINGKSQRPNVVAIVRNQEDFGDSEKPTNVRDIKRARLKKAGTSTIADFEAVRDGREPPS